MYYVVFITDAPYMSLYIWNVLFYLRLQDRMSFAMNPAIAFVILCALGELNDSGPFVNAEITLGRAIVALKFDMAH